MFRDRVLLVYDEVRRVFFCSSSSCGSFVLFLLLPLLSGNVLVLIPTYLSQRSVRI